jgi:hypothetical protein
MKLNTAIAMPINRVAIKINFNASPVNLTTENNPCPTALNPSAKMFLCIFNCLICFSALSLTSLAASSFFIA